MEVSFRRDLNHNYMMIENNQVSGSEYPLRMVEQNRIARLLNCQIRKRDGSTYLYYEITSKQPLSQIYETRNMNSQDIKELLFGIQSALEEARKYLLNPEDLLLLPEYIYMDVESHQIQLCYYPCETEKGTRLLGELSEYILKHLDHGDRRAVELGYELFGKASMENFSLQDTLKSLLEKSGKEEEQSDAVPDAAETGRHPEQAIYLRNNSLEKSDDEREHPEFDDLDYEPGEKEVRKKKKSAKKSAKARTAILCICFILLLALLFGAVVYFGKFDLTQTGGLAFGLLAVLWIIYNSVCGKNKRKSNAWMEEEDEEEEDTEEDYIELLMGNREKGKPDESPETSNLCGETRCLAETEFWYPVRLVSMAPEQYPDIVLNQAAAVIGKMKGQADIRLAFDSVSRVHARIECRQKKWFLTDLNSMNGTFVNGERLQPKEERELKDGDKISFAVLHYTMKD